MPKNQHITTYRAFLAGYKRGKISPSAPKLASLIPQLKWEIVVTFCSQLILVRKRLLMSVVQIDKL